MSPRKYRAVVEYEGLTNEHPELIPCVGDRATAFGGAFQGTITSVEPILSAEDVIDEIEALDTINLGVQHSVRKIIDRYRSQEKA